MSRGRAGALPLLLLLLLLGAAGASGAEKGWVYLLPERGGELLVLDDGGSVGTVRLGREGATGIFPTPGGKYVFVTFPDAEVAVVDAEAQALDRRFGLEQGAPEQFLFSPSGDKAYVSLRGSSRVLVFSHQRSRLELRGSLSLGIAGAPITLNRRGTRLYRSSADGLDFYLETTGETLRRVPLRGGAASWSFSPDYRFLWGVSLADGRLSVVDERSAKLAAEVDGAFAPFEPAATNDGAYLVAASRDRLEKIGARTFRPETSIELPGRARDLASPGTGDAVWLLVGEEIIEIDLGSGKEIRSVSPGVSIRDIAAVTLRPGEGYACF